MRDSTQIDRYKKLLTFLNEHFKEAVNIEKVEEVSHYSYRNINRIFQALHHETIGKFIKRMRLEKAAQYLKYSNETITDIAFEVGFEDIASFSKAFKKKYACTPSAFRSSSMVTADITRKLLYPQNDSVRPAIPHTIEFLPDFEFISLSYKGAYENLSAIENVWGQLFKYADAKDLLSHNTIYFTQILDDEEITDSIHCRIVLGIILEQKLPFEPEGLFEVRIHKRQRYAKFIHRGSHESSTDTYTKIYASWLIDIKLELADLPTLEFHPNDNGNTPPEELITEIYIPIR